jgi:adenosine kinase
VVEEILVCGSVAIDVIGKYPGKFADYEKKYGFTGLNISLQLASLNFSFGGCGMNIAWGLNQLGIKVLPVSVAGTNFEDAYRTHLNNAGINTRYIVLDEQFDHCAMAVILGDEEGNQLTAFHAGSSVSPLRVLPDAIPDIEQIKMAILAPEDAPIMLRQARELANLSIPFMFDPGQGLAEFSSNETRELMDLCSYVIVNQHEWDILQDKTSSTGSELLSQASTIIVTRGENGSTIYSSQHETLEISAVGTSNPVDPTGCGDAYRAGYLAGLLRGKSTRTCGQLGALLATCNLESDHTQTYQVSREEFCRRYEAAYGEALCLD